jgi:hypothetical protein
MPQLSTAGGSPVRAQYRPPKDAGNGVFFYYDFRVAVERAEAEAEVEAVAILRSAMVEGDWRATVGFLERRYPSRWRRQQTTELTGADGGPIAVERTVDLSKLSDDDLAVLEELRRRVAAD